MSIITELDSQLNRNSFEAVTGNPSAQTKAVFKIRVTRATAAIAVDLPYAIFGRNFFSNGYGTIIDVPTGLTLTVTNGVISGTPADYGTVTLSYTDGVNTDEINITSQGAAPRERHVVRSDDRVRTSVVRSSCRELQRKHRQR